MNRRTIPVDDPLKYNKGHLYRPSTKRPDKQILGKGSVLTINVDWLEIFCEAKVDPKTGLNLPNVNENVMDYPIGEDLLLRKRPTGTPMYLHCFDLFYSGAEVAVVQTNPRAVRGPMKENSFTLKLQNHLLYQTDWMDILIDVLAQLNADVHNVTRLDIAIDGPNYLPEFLNYYLKQDQDRKAYHLRGKSTFNCFQQNHNTMDFKRFQIGSAKSEKAFSIYCKSAEIEVSNKKYIQRFWERSGATWTESEVYRCELRMKSKAVDQLVDFEFERLTEPEYLASIFRTHAKNAFEFAYVRPGDSNTRRYETIELIDYDQLGGQLLTKTERAQVTHRYKAKMQLHVSSFAILSGTARLEHRESLLDGIISMIGTFDLYDWFVKKAPEWISLYDRSKHNLDFVRQIEAHFEEVQAQD